MEKNPDSPALEPPAVVRERPIERETYLVAEVASPRNIPERKYPRGQVQTIDDLLDEYARPKERYRVFLDVAHTSLRYTIAPTTPAPATPDPE